jgi:hypothetical protein
MFLRPRSVLHSKCEPGAARMDMAASPSGLMNAAELGWCASDEEAQRQELCRVLGEEVTYTAPDTRLPQRSPEPPKVIPCMQIRSPHCWTAMAPAS